MNDERKLPIMIVTNPEIYYPAQGKTLKARLDEIHLGDDGESEINRATGKKIIRDKLLGLTRITEIVSVVLNWNEEVEKEIKIAKQEHLLCRYFEKVDQTSETVADIAKFLSNPQGSILFNKILRIQDESPPDIELAEHLSAALKHITSTNFIDLFQEHRYALSIIERLTPQEMSLITQSSAWQDFNVGALVTSGTNITSDWIPSFIRSTFTSDIRKDERTTDRIAHSIRALEGSGLIRAARAEQNRVRCELTNIGTIVLPYLQGVAPVPE